MTTATPLCAGCDKPIADPIIWHQEKAYHERCLPESWGQGFSTLKDTNRMQRAPWDPRAREGATRRSWHQQWDSGNDDE